MKNKKSRANHARYVGIRYLYSSPFLPIQYPTCIGVFSDSLSILEGVKLTDMLVSLADIYGFTFPVMAVKFQEICRRCRLIYGAKAFRRHTIKRTVQQHAFRIRIISALVVRKADYHGILAQSLEGTVIEDVTMVLPGISNPHESTIAGKGTVIEIGWTSTQHRVTSSINHTVEPVGRTIHLKSITITDYVLVYD